MFVAFMDNLLHPHELINIIIFLIFIKIFLITPPTKLLSHERGKFWQPTNIDSTVNYAIPEHRFSVWLIWHKHFPTIMWKRPRLNFFFTKKVNILQNYVHKQNKIGSNDSRLIEKQHPSYLYGSHSPSSTCSLSWQKY